MYMGYNRKMLLLFLVALTLTVSGCTYNQYDQDLENNVNITESNISFTGINTTEEDDEITASISLILHGYNVTDVGIDSQSDLHSNSRYENYANNTTKIVADLHFTEEMFSNYDSTIKYDESIVHTPKLAILVQTKEGKDKLTPENELEEKNIQTDGEHQYTTFLEDRVFFTTSDIQYTEYIDDRIKTNIYTNMLTLNHTDVVNRIEKQVRMIDNSLHMSKDNINERYIYLSNWFLRKTSSSVSYGFATDRTSKYDQFVYIKDSRIGTHALPHEIIHNYQPYTTTEEIDWIIEGFANYLGGVYQSRATNRNLSTIMDGMTEVDKYENLDGKLIDPDTWEGETDYINGTRLLHEVDREIRENSNKTIITLFDRLTKYDHMTVDKFQDEIRKITDEKFAQKIIDKTKKNSINIEFDFSSPLYPKD